MKILHSITSEQSNLLAIFKRTILTDAAVFPDTSYITAAHNCFKKELVVNVWFNDICECIIAEQPNVLLLTISPDRDFVDNIVNNTNLKYRQIWYVHHGLIHNVDTVKFDKWSRHINYVVSCKQGFRLLSTFLLHVYKINGLPQFDLLQKPPIPRPRTILLVNGSNDSFYKSTAHIEEVVRYLKLEFPKYNVLIKNKRYKSDKVRELFCELDCIPENETLYDYLGVESIIVLEGGTAYFECLVANPRTILCGPELLGTDLPRGLLVVDNNIDLMNICGNAVPQIYIDRYIESVIGALEPATSQLLTLFAQN